MIPINTVTIPAARYEYLYDRERETLHAKIVGLEPAGWPEALQREQDEAARERTRLWYVALTRALGAPRGLVVYPTTARCDPVKA